jgi:hypothetical protein
VVVKHNLYVFVSHQFGARGVVSGRLVRVDIDQFSVSLVLEQNSLHAIRNHLVVGRRV